MQLKNFITYLEAELNYSSHTVLAYQKDVEQFLDFLGTKQDVDFNFSLKVVNVRNWLVELMDNGYSTTSVRRKLSSLRVFSNYLYKIGDIEKNELKLLHGPKLTKKLPVFVRSKIMDELLNGSYFGDDFEGLRDKLIVDFLYSTGMRLSELVGLNDEDVDLSLMQIKVMGKGAKERLIPIGHVLKEEIVIYLQARSTLTETQDRAFFVRSNGLRIYRGLVYNLVNRALGEVSSLTKRSPHVLRHSFATNMLNNGADLQVIKEILGHSSLVATEIYTHTTFRELEKVYKQAHPRA